MKFPILVSILALMAAGTATAQTQVFKAPSKAEFGRHVINPQAVGKKYAKTVARAAALPEGTVLYEDFEEWNGEDKTWQPEGWTFDHKMVEAGHPLWAPYGYDPYDPVNYPSNTYIFPSFTEPIDEWLISPEFEAADGMIFMADIYNAGSYYFDLDAEMFTSEINSIEKANDFIIHITTDNGATWTPLYSVPDEMLKLNYTKGYEYWERHGWETITLDLSAYVGKKARIAFQIVGNPVGMNDPNSQPTSEASGVDNIRVGFPVVEVSYQKPLSSLYFGLNDDDQYVPGTIMVAPVYQPVTYTNTSSTVGATYSWSYEHNDGVLTSDDQDELVVTYRTNHETEATSRNNLFLMPELTGTGEFFSDTKFALPGFVQAGGRAEYEIHYVDTDEREVLQLGMTVADPVTEGTRTYADITVPYFGYNKESNRYWTCRVFDISVNEYEKNYRGSQDDWSQLTHYANFFYASDAPLVIEGIRTNAYGRGYGPGGTMPNAKFKADIFFINDNFEISEDPVYSVELEGKNVKVVDRYTSNHILYLDFKFPQPVVISSKDCQAFVVSISGFNDEDNIDYFSPEMSEKDNPDGIALGWYGLKTCWGGIELPLSWSPVLYQTERTELPGEQLISFYIMLDAYYPWLENIDGKNAIELEKGESVSVMFDSYHVGEALEFEGLPEWLTATAEGHYDKTKVTFTAVDGYDNGQATVKIKGYGVSKEIDVTLGKAGVNNVIVDDNNGPVQIFNIGGQNVTGRNLEPGVYIQRQGSKVSKIIVGKN